MKNIGVFIIIFSLLNTGLKAQDNVLDGKKLFKINCKACHSIDQKLVGPALKGVEERRDSAWIYSFIKGSQKMIENGDETAMALFSDFNEVIMPDQNVNNDEIKAILEYIKGAEIAALADNPIQRPQSVPYTTINMLKFDNYLFWIPFTITIVFWFLLFYFLTIHSDARDEIIKQKMNTR